MGTVAMNDKGDTFEMSDTATKTLDQARDEALKIPVVIAKGGDIVGALKAMLLLREYTHWLFDKTGNHPKLSDDLEANLSELDSAADEPDTEAGVTTMVGGTFRKDGEVDG